MSFSTQKSKETKNTKSGKEMSPPVAMHILLHQCWSQRLHQCCQYCGELNTTTTSHHRRRSTPSLHPYQGHHRHNSTTRREVEEESNNHSNPVINVEERLDHLNSIHDQWHGQPVQMKTSQNNKTSVLPVVRLVYSKRSYNNYRKEAEQLLHQLPFPARYELVDDTSPDHDDSVDEDMDLIADLLDAYNLESSTTTTTTSHNIEEQDAEALRQYLEKLKQKV